MRLLTNLTLNPQELHRLYLCQVTNIRDCLEKTVQAQSQAIYKKSSCRGRSEFSAYFLEDLLPPQNLI